MAGSTAPYSGVRAGLPIYVLILYNKPYLTVPDQVDLFRARGMLITNGARAVMCLHRIGYYRLSGYAYPFRNREIVDALDGKKAERIHESFKPGTTLTGVMELYVFDKRLRLLFLDAIERVEVGIRVEIALLLGLKGAFAHRDPQNFNRYFREIDQETTESPHTRFCAK